MIDVIKTKIVDGKSVSILLYSIDKEDREIEDGHKQIYEVRVSLNDKLDNWYTDSEFYFKKDALRVFKLICKELQQENDDKVQHKYLLDNFLPLLKRI